MEWNESKIREVGKQERKKAREETRKWNKKKPKDGIEKKQRMKETKGNKEK